MACSWIGFQSSCFDVIVAFPNSHKLDVLEPFFFFFLEASAVWSYGPESKLLLLKGASRLEFIK